MVVDSRAHRAARFALMLTIGKLAVYSEAFNIFEHGPQRLLNVCHPQFPHAGDINQQAAKLTGETFVVTGTLEAFTRDEIKDIIRKAGGKISSSVSTKTNYVVVGADPGSKAATARELGVTILSESQFKSLLGL